MHCGLIAFLLAVSAVSADGMPQTALVPSDEEEVGFHHLSKRQTSCRFFFLAEPPPSLQCNPQPNNILTLRCKFLVGNTAARTLDIGWFFSLDGIVGELVQISRFPVGIFSAFENILVVQHALPGAYFCSASVEGQVFDSRALRVDAQTLQNVCRPRQPPTLQPPRSIRCAQGPLPINSNVLVVVNRTVVTNTIDLQGGLQTPTPSYTIAEFQRTIPLPLVAETPLPTEPGNDNAVGIGIGVAIAVIILLACLVGGLIVGVVCSIRRRERNHPIIPIPKKKRRRTIMDMLYTRKPRVTANTEPLMSRPPERPPPVLLETVNLDADEAHGEQTEMAQYASQFQPYPYERVGEPSLPRYSMEPGTKTKRDLFPATPDALTHPEPEQTASTGLESTEAELEDAPQGDWYYSRPKFHREGSPCSSTSTHTYGDLTSTASSIYISPQQLEPFLSREATLAAVDEIENSSSDFSEEGSYSDGDEGSTLVDTSLEEPNTWLGKSPETGQTKASGNGDNITYVNAKWEVDKLRKEVLEGERPQKAEEGLYMNTLRPGNAAMSLLRSQFESNITSGSADEVKYINSRPVPSPRNAGGDTAQSSTKNAPPKKKTRKAKRNRQQKKVTYTGLLHQTKDYTHVYSMSLRRESKEN